MTSGPDPRPDSQAYDSWSPEVVTEEAEERRTDDEVRDAVDGWERFDRAVAPIEDAARWPARRRDVS